MSGSPQQIGRTLVAYHGSKPKELKFLIEYVQKTVQQLLPPDVYEPYELEQVHGTLIGLEGVRLDSGEVVNRNFLELRNQAIRMDLDGAFEFLRSSPLLPMSIRLAGFSAREQYGFESRGRHPFERSFCIEGNKAVLIGWPLRCMSEVDTHILDELRRSFEQFGILYRYFRTSEDFDNDFHVTLGLVEQTKLSDSAKRETERRIREVVGSLRAVILRLDFKSLSLVDYEDGSLPVSQTRSTPVSEIA